MVKMNYFWFNILLLFLMYHSCYSQSGPDPWDYDSSEISKISNNADVPPDLRGVPKKINLEHNVGLGEWFYKRILAIVLKSGQVKKNDDDSVDISLQMRFDREQWSKLNTYTTLHNKLNEDMFRTSMGYIEEAIYKPTVTEKIAVAWNEYINHYLTEYKAHLTWVISGLTIIVGVIWLWNHISHKHIIIIIVTLLYIYEAFISYKEAEQKEMEKFLSAINTCKWYIWTSNCEIPAPDPLIFLKHLNPLKIGIRMFTTLISEPMIMINASLKTMLSEVTGGLWFPFDKIMYGFLVIIINISLIFLMVMIIFNYILNIPFNLSFLGLMTIRLNQRNRNFVNKTHRDQLSTDNSDRISGPNLERLLNIFSHACLTEQTSQNHRNGRLQIQSSNSKSTQSLRRSASTGRLSEFGSEHFYNNNSLNNFVRKRNNTFGKQEVGSGDA